MNRLLVIALVCLIVGNEALSVNKMKLLKQKKLSLREEPAEETTPAPAPEETTSTPTPEESTPAPATDAPEAPTSDFPEPDLDAYQTRADEILKKIEEAHHKMGAKLRGVAGTAPAEPSDLLPGWFKDIQTKLMTSGEWTGDVEEEGSKLLEEFINEWLKWKTGKEVPANLKAFFGYLGRSAQNNADAKKHGFKGSGDMGGAMGGFNWCTQATTYSLVKGLKEVGIKPSHSMDKFQQWINELGRIVPDSSPAEDRLVLYNGQAYGAPLQPGDMVMYLWKTAQYGGHTVTVVYEEGDYFLHVSGNTGVGVGVGIGQSKRIKAPPSENFDIAKCNNVATEETRKASSEYIHTQAGFANDKDTLVYSIVRFGKVCEKAVESVNLDHQCADGSNTDACTQSTEIKNKYKLAKSG